MVPVKAGDEMQADVLLQRTKPLKLPDVSLAGMVLPRCKGGADAAGGHFWLRSARYDR